MVLISHENKRSLYQQAYDSLQNMVGYGRSKYEDKRNKVSDRYIYSYNSMIAYQKHVNYFIKWCKDSEFVRDALGRKPRTLDECKQFVEPYIRTREKQGLSAYTIKLEKAALAKLYQCEFDFKTKGTKRSDITRSRVSDTKGDKHFSETRNADMVNACRCVGFRRSELERAKSSDLVMIGDKYYMCIIGKGGKERLAMLVGSDEEVEKAVRYIQTLTGHNHVHSNADIHSYRADYATRVYKLYAQDIKTLKGQFMNYTDVTGKTDANGNDIYKRAVYYCKRDEKGRALDRNAMIIASINLGHNRESVVGNHYIR